MGWWGRVQTVRSGVVALAVLGVLALLAVTVWFGTDDGAGPGGGGDVAEGRPPADGSNGGTDDRAVAGADDGSTPGSDGAARPGTDGRGGRGSDGSPDGDGGGRDDGPSTPLGPPVADCGDGRHLCVGAAKAVVTPTQAHIDGVTETRLLVGSRLQQFNLGGFGINPLQGVPDPIGAIGTTLTHPADVRQHVGPSGPDDLWLRAMVLQQPGGDTVALVTLDATGAGNVVQARLTEAVAQATGIDPANVLFGQTHTHAGPDLQGLWGGVPQDWITSLLYPAAVAAVTEALASVRPVTLDVRHGPLPDFNNYRRPKRIDPDIDADTVATLVQAIDVDSGAVVANLLQFNAHPTSVDERPRAPHPDYVLGAVDRLEHETGGTAIYFNGAIADASASGGRLDCPYADDGAYGSVRCRGEALADAVLGFAVDRTLAPTIEVRHQSVTLPVTNPLFLGAGGLGAFNRYYDFLELPAADLPLIGGPVADALIDLPQLTPTATTLVSRITIGGAVGGLELVTVPGETTGTFADWVRGLAAADAHLVVLGLTHNSFGYILPEEEFSYIDGSGDAGFIVPFTGYEEFVSLGPLTAPLLRAVGYVPLFEADPARALPPVLTACFDDGIASEGCALHVLGRHLDDIQVGLASQCSGLGLPDAFCSLLNPKTPLASFCVGLGLPTGLCALV